MPACAELAELNLKSIASAVYRCPFVSLVAPRPFGDLLSAPNICWSPPSADDLHVVLQLDVRARRERDRPASRRRLARRAPGSPSRLVL